MTKTIVVKTADLSKDFKFDGVSLEPQFKNIEKFYGIPNALHSVDKKFSTSTFRTVLEAAAPELQVMVDDSNNVQVLDPRSRYLDDAGFDQMLAAAGPDVKVEKRGFEKQATVVLQDSDTDVYLGDVFKRQIVITRRAEGGVSINTAIERQVCSNGLMVPDKQFSATLRNPSKFSTELFSSYYDAAGSFNIDEYLQKLFSRDGSPIQASIADIMKMQDCLIRITDDEDLGNLLYRTDRMKDFYAEQAIDIDSLARQYLDKLPSGLTYYQALNILTSGAKAMAEKTIDNQIAVAAFCTPQKMKCLQQVKELQFTGMPQFSNAEIRLFMGDGYRTAQEVLNSLKS